MNAGSLVPFDLSLFQKGQQNQTRWEKLHASQFKQRAVSQSSHQLWSFSAINNQSRVAQQRKAVILSICANVPSRQWPTIILERLWTHKSQMYYEYESIVQMHTYVPPTTSLSSPTWRWTTKLSFFLEKYWKSRISIYLHSLSRCRAIGCQFSVSPPPTYSMGSVHKTACAGYSAQIITGSNNWKRQIEK